MSICIETRNLNHRFSKQDQVLHNIDLSVPTGSIYGFLGPNGAGKTTTLRLLLGLLKKQEGEINIFGKPFLEHRLEVLRNVGSMIESPSIYAHLTATENLMLLQKVYQCPITRIKEVLEIVGLSNTGKKKAGKFSLGMKQRLSIAIALLHHPSLLILDEPTNGLDPNGILEVRELLKKLNEEHQITILISSHLLMEIEKLVSHVGIIHRGALLFQGTLKDLHIKQNQSSMISFETNDPEKTVKIISAQGLNTSMVNGTVQLSIIERKKIAEINRELINQGIDVYQISTVQNDLESIFMDLVKN